MGARVKAKDLPRDDAGPEVDVRTPDGFLFSLLKPVLSNERQRQVLLERMGWRSKPRTLQDVGEELGITRERVRQIEMAAMARVVSPKASGALKPLYDLLRAMLRDIAPVMNLRGISKALQLLFGWHRPLSEEAIAKLLPAFPELRLLHGRYVCFRDFRCVECPSLPEILESVPLAEAAEEIELFPLARRLRAQMIKTEACQQCGQLPRRASVDLALLAIDRSSEAARQTINGHRP